MLLAFAQRALNHASQHDDAAIGIKPRIKDQRLQLVVGGPFGGGMLLTIASSTSGTPWPVFALISSASVASSPTAPSIISLVRSMSALGKIDLVDDRNDLQPVVDGHVGIGQRLRLDTLRSIDHQQRAFARGQRARNFVAEVHVPGRVDQVELIGLAVLRRDTSCGPNAP